MPSFGPPRRFWIAITVLAGSAAIGFPAVFSAHADEPVQPASSASVDAGPPPPAGYFDTLPVGSWSGLPGGWTCSSMLHRSTWEPRPQNDAANHYMPPRAEVNAAFAARPMAVDNTYDQLWDTWLLPRVSGHHTGTTDEIIQWAACKWGFDEDEVRAIATTESWWHQSQTGDVTTRQALCPPGMTAPCPRSFGIHQVTWNSDPMGTYPASTTSTAFNLDASLLVHRICFEGYTTWLRDIGYSSYAAGDEWGCVGQWYSGNWHDVGAQTYISKVQGYMATKPWTQVGF
jgi:hypothetical protein